MILTLTYEEAAIMKEVVGNKHLMLDINDNLEQIQPVAHALSSTLRLKIILLIGRRSMSINELARELDVPVSTISLNVSVLEKAGLLFSETQPGVRGTMRLCSRLTDRVLIQLEATEERPHIVEQVEMPIGLYSGAYGIKPTCGLAGNDGPIGVFDDVRSFYDPRRAEAQLIWFRCGFLEYRFAPLPRCSASVDSIEISFEACSETLNYRNEWESDISLEINGMHVGTWLSPGDFGGRRGVLNPDWWSDISTQYGHLKTWRVDENGSFIDRERVGDLRLSELNLSKAEHIAVRIGVDPSCAHVGGMNLFGAGFGDVPQHIILRYAFH